MNKKRPQSEQSAILWILGGVAGILFAGLVTWIVGTGLSRPAATWWLLLVPIVFFSLVLIVRGAEAWREFRRTL
jgi:uncharacterized membrane protein YccC